MRNLVKDIKGNRPILIQPSTAMDYLSTVSNLEIPLTAQASDMEGMLSAIFGKKETLEKFPPYAIVPVKGVIGKNLSMLESLCGCCDINAVQEMLEECEADANIECVILSIDSPGGVSVGVPELAEKIKTFSKKVIAFTESEACSAAYWIASQASEFYATPSSTVGSVGVYIAYEDLSKLYENEGIKVDVVKSGIFKGAGIPGTSLDAGQRKMLQDEVTDIHMDFKTAVKSVRSFVEDSSLEGQCFSGKKGAEAGLVTGLVQGFDDLMEKLDPAVHKQMEADEENDARQEVSELITEGNDEEDDDENSISKMSKLSASEKALMGINLTDKIKIKLEEVGDAEPEDEENGDMVVSDFDGTITKEDDSGDVNESVVNHLKKMKEEGKQIHVVTGRHESRKEATEEYLKSNDVPYDEIHLNPSDSHDSIPAYKVDKVKSLEGANKVKHILENDPECIKAYEAAGYKCIHPKDLESNPAMDMAEDHAGSGKRPLQTDENPNKKDLNPHR
jgi:signal peptide peptidase SppA